MTTYEARFCPTCGTATEHREHDERERSFCPSCGEFVFRNAAPGASVTVVDGDRVLLVERGVAPDRGLWAVPGGHLEYDEPPAVGAARELAEETGVAVDPDDLRLAGTTFSVTDGKGYLAVDYAVPRALTEGDPVAGSDAAAAGFRDPETLSGGPLRDLARPRLAAAFEILG